MALKVFDLQCESGHIFEGWFGSDDSFEMQQAKGILACPVCNSHAISKKLAAPRINTRSTSQDHNTRSAHPEPGQDTARVARPDAAQLQQLQAQLLQHMRTMVRKSEDVGARFATEARRMHEGDIEERPIRGTATAQERQELLEDGIEVQVIPAFLDDDRLQ